ELGITPSRGRPRVSNDNPYSESLFRTLKYCPQWPQDGFASLDCAFHAIRPPSPPTSGHLFHAHPARQSERSDAGSHC
ncbi:hypothetical protein KZA17_28540, partial [Pseudomonas syringae]|nr:hypothetical protein [Pseudomonas syringae]